MIYSLSETFKGNNLFPNRLPKSKETLKSMKTDPASAKSFLEQLVNSENKYRLLADSVTDVIWVLDMENLVIIYVSPSVERLIGYPPEKVVKMGLQQFLSPESMGRIYDVLEESLAEKDEPDRRHIRLELPVLHQNGSIVRIEVTPRFLRDERREPVGILGVARDCTERLNAEEKLRRSEERYRTILDNIEEGFCEIDLNGNILFANDAACSISGFSHAELFRMNYRDILDEENAARMSESLALILQTRKPVKGFDYELIKKDGTRRQVETSIMLMTDKHNTPIGFRGVGRDITQRKKEERKRKQAYEELDRRIAERTLELAETNHSLQEKTLRLEEANIALRVLLKKKDENKKSLENQMMTNIIELILPTLEKIQKIGLNDRQQEYAEMIRTNLNHITSPFLHTLSQNFSDLTPTEIQIAGHIRHGKTTKEIADLLNLALSTIDFHRKNIRKKLLIHNRKINLRTHLLSLE